LTEQNEILSLFKKLINEKLNNKGNNIVNDLNNLLSETETSKQALHCSLTARPLSPPPPPPSQFKPKNNFSIIKCLPQQPPVPPPPPPPPPSLLLKSSIVSTNKNSIGNNPPTQAADIPRPLRPKALPLQGRRLRHLQWAKVPSNAVVVGGNNEANSFVNQNIWQGLEQVDRELSNFDFF
jgi:hypothetical protein